MVVNLSNVWHSYTIKKGWHKFYVTFKPLFFSVHHNFPKQNLHTQTHTKMIEECSCEKILCIFCRRCDIWYCTLILLTCSSVVCICVLIFCLFLFVHVIPSNKMKEFEHFRQPHQMERIFRLNEFILLVKWTPVDV